MQTSSFDRILHNISLIEKNRKWLHLSFIIGVFLVFDPIEVLHAISVPSLFILFTINAYVFLKFAHFLERLEAINKTLLNEIFVNADLMTEYPNDETNKLFNGMLSFISMGNITCDYSYYYKGYAYGRARTELTLADSTTDLLDYMDLSTNKKLNNYRNGNTLLTGKLIQQPIISNKYRESTWNQKEDIKTKPFYQTYINILLYSSIIYSVVILSVLFFPNLDIIGLVSNDVKMLFEAVQSGRNTHYTVYEVTLLALLTKLRIWADLSNIIIIIQSGCTSISQITEMQAIKKTSIDDTYTNDSTYTRLKHDYLLHLMIFIGTCIVFQFFPIS